MNLGAYMNAASYTVMKMDRPRAMGVWWTGLAPWEFGGPASRHGTFLNQPFVRRYVNLGAYMNAASYTVMESCPLTRAFKLFRNLGSSSSTLEISPEIQGQSSEIQGHNLALTVLYVPHSLDNGHA